MVRYRMAGASLRRSQLRYASMMKFPTLACPVFIAATACSSAGVTPAMSGPDGSVDGLAVDGGGGAESYTVNFGPITVPPHVERTQCVVKRLGNSEKIHAGAFHNVLGDASHHMIVYRVGDAVEQPTPFDCKPFTDTLDPTKGSTLMITQKRDETLALPKGVAYTLDANQMIRLEMHYINASAKEKTLTSSTTVTKVADADFQNEADFLFIGDPDISLPPGQKTTLGPIFFPLPKELADSKFFAITGHEHQFGTNVKVATASNDTDPGTPVYDVADWTWSEPKTVIAEPAFSAPPNGGFRFSCEWTNTSSANVKFGESADNEMCFFWAYYYPSKGTKVCFHTAQGGPPVDFCCPGSSYCKFLKK
ncbi:MAG: hypothetical protein NVS3B20_06680 [Polyangiales bacterium]